MNKYVFKPYYPIFPELFEKEKERLSKYLTGEFRIEHVGSTAIPNLGGKGIIDIYIVAPKDQLDRMSQEVLNSGYEYRPRVSADQHVFHRIDLPDPIEGTRRYHIHISYPEADDFRQAIAFRDYLREHPEDVERYVEVKKKAANEANQDKDTYMRIKTPVIQEILEKAKNNLTTMRLVQPSIQYKDSFLNAVKEYQNEVLDDRRDYLELNIDELQSDFSSYIERVLSESEGKNVPEGYVPQTTYWLIDNDDFIGSVSIRHTLTEHLLKEGGHIGYDIRPSKRKMGYGKRILELALPKAKQLGIQKVLVTCNETNIGSKKIIEANGGILEDRLELHEGKPAKLRYWISVN